MLVSNQVQDMILIIQMVKIKHISEMKNSFFLTEKKIIKSFSKGNELFKCLNNK